MFEAEIKNAAFILNDSLVIESFIHLSMEGKAVVATMVSGYYLNGFYPIHQENDAYPVAIIIPPR